MVSSYIPKRGDSIWLNFDPQKGKEIEGVILTDQVRSLDWKARQTTKITSATDSIVEKAVHKLKLILQMKIL